MQASNFPLEIPSAPRLHESPKLGNSRADIVLNHWVYHTHSGFFSLDLMICQGKMLHHLLHQNVQRGVQSPGQQQGVRLSGGLPEDATHVNS